MCNSQLNLNFNTMMSSISTSSTLACNTHKKGDHLFTLSPIPEALIETDDGAISPQISTKSHAHRTLTLDKKQCCSCGTFVTPVWRRHSYSSILNLDTSPLTFDPYSSSDEASIAHGSDNDSSSSILICSEYAAQKRYLCNACGIKYKKLNQASFISSSRSLQKRKSLDYSIDIKPKAEAFSVYDTNRENFLGSNVPIFPIKSPKPMPKVRRPSTSFIFFCREYRKSLTKQNPSCSFGQISKILGEMWSSLPDSHKQVCASRSVINAIYVDLHCSRSAG